jgi:hypothetical protein
MLAWAVLVAAAGTAATAQAQIDRHFGGTVRPGPGALADYVPQYLADARATVRARTVTAPAEVSSDGWYTADERLAPPGDVFLAGYHPAGQIVRSQSPEPLVVEPAPGQYYDPSDGATTYADGAGGVPFEGDPYGVAPLDAFGDPSAGGCADCGPPVSPTPVSAWKPLLPVWHETTTYYYGQGFLGQPKAYVPGEPVKNFFRYFTP